MASPTVDSKARKQFPVHATIPKRDAAGKVVLDEEKNPVVDRVVGDFTFRQPSLRDLVDIQVRAAQISKGAPVDGQTETLIEAMAMLPTICVKAPEDWTWDLEPEQAADLMAIYAEVSAQLEKF
jgi:hypothetical protein